FPGTPIRGLHDPGTAAGHQGEPRARELSTDLTTDLVVGMVGLEPRRAEDGHAWPDEVQSAEAANELEHDADDSPELGAARLRALEEVPDLWSGVAVAPGVVSG